MISVGIEDLTNIPALGYLQGRKEELLGRAVQADHPKSNRVKPCMAMHFNKLNM